ncbi:MAG: thiamine pyrophosphate-dependent dehydrogenase E1 component subunit alpha [Dehalococcoidia bacterium]|nr:thiamine pyrophosphate-dependent dehydrogenase E1 component subunit alpha [Dehalococcoidia bacterium]
MPVTKTKEAKPRAYTSLGLKAEDLMEMYYKMVLVRAIDERAWALNRMGKVGFVASCRGHEAAQVGSAYAMQPGKDFILPYYRDLGVVITIGFTTREHMLGLLSRSGDPSSGGRQMPGHWGKKELRIISGSSPVATQVPHAAGIAYATMIRKEDAVTIVHFGDGATSKGDVHEGMNLAGIYKLPVIFLCENNGLAISVPQSKQMAVKDVSIRAQGYGFKGVTIDGFDILAVYAAVKEARARAVRGEGPTFIECKVYRLLPHSSDDNDLRYRTKEEVEEARKKDPVERFRRYLQEEGILDDAKAEEFRTRARKEVDEATDYAERASDLGAEELLTQVYAE